jgi:predicted Zn-dependent protease with MMP-like domain
LSARRVNGTMRIMMSRATFEQLVDEAIASLPDEVLGWLDNVAIVVGGWPTPEQMAQAGLRPGALLFGLYVGVPKIQRGFTYGETVPDKIVIFQGPIERVYRTPDQIREQVRKTVLHEIGHHFGLGEGDLRNAGV